MSSPVRIPALIVGGTGYVAGELLRLVGLHPVLELAGISSESQPGTQVSAAFPHLAPLFPDTRFMSQEALADRIAAGRIAIFSAAPHVQSAGAVSALLKTAATRGTTATVVDVSADFRFRSAADFEAVYKHPHGAPDLLPQFFCGLPEHVEGTPAAHVGHPGCFATAMLAGLVPLLRAGLLDGPVYASGVTGSTGAGRTHIPTTHHPERHANLFAYNPLQHRHTTEVIRICEQVSGVAPDLSFIPHSGPFARGIHMTLQGRQKSSQDADHLREQFARFYADCEFIRIVSGTPRVKDVAGSNHCHIGIATEGRSVAVLVVLDNLIKGAAGGAVQWMNRLLGLPESAGLTAPAIGWT